MKLTDPLLLLFLVFFWAPAFKWGLVVAGLADINRPAEKVCSVMLRTSKQTHTVSHVPLIESHLLLALVLLVLLVPVLPRKISLPQSTALTATGFIWARYSTQIIPFNYSLLTVNLFVGLTGLYSLSRRIQ
jgi:hypothetical protein